MPLLLSKGALAIAAVVAIALNRRASTSSAALPTDEPDRADSILTAPDAVRQSRARDRRVALTEIGRLLKDQYDALAHPVSPLLGAFVESSKPQK
jgi:hypothetical protein